MTVADAPRLKQSSPAREIVRVWEAPNKRNFALWYTTRLACDISNRDNYLRKHLKAWEFPQCFFKLIGLKRFRQDAHRSVVYKCAVRKFNDG